MSAASFWHWFAYTDAGLAARIAAGAAIFGALAILDFRRNGSAATRWREYAFLLAMIAIVLIYGIFNDQITSRISWEYFYYGKGLNEVLGDSLPPDPARLHWEAAKVGMKATWTAGLLIGVALLLANNPRKNLPRLGYRDLFRRIPILLAITIATAAAFGVAGYYGLFTHFSTDFHQMLRRNEFRPRRFMAVFGIHLGGYVGGLLATLWATVSIFRQRLNTR